MSKCEQLQYDFIVVGSGIAGLWTAVHLADTGKVALLTKEELRQGSTVHAQGGIAVALSDEDEPELHLRDTLEAGAGLCDVPAAEILVFEGPEAVRQLIERGVQFDMENSEYAFGREAAHSQRRIIHAHGDATGAEIERALAAAAGEHNNIDIFENTQAAHILTVDGRCVGIQAHDFAAGKPVFFVSGATALATGGLGCLYRVTTNPPVVTGDGIALAYRAGATLKDIEFVQFHPTALAAPGFPKFLMSEALRGDGAQLLNHNGEPFMQRHHKMGNLAPRDEVARAVMEEMKAAQQPFVYLDLQPIGKQRLEERFPTIVAECRDRGFAVPDQPVPVSPAAHYFMGGVDIDVDCMSSMPGLFAVGECGCISAHGANRLASNSLLEGLVFGRRCAIAMANAEALSAATIAEIARREPQAVPVGSGFYHDLRDIMWDNMGVVRSEATLRNALQHVAHLSVKVSESEEPTQDGMEAANALLLAGLMAKAALSRRESRGAHYRVEHQDTSRKMRQHTLVTTGDNGEPQIDYRPVELERLR